MMTSSEMDLILKVQPSATIPAETINHASSHFFFYSCVIMIKHRRKKEKKDVIYI